MEKSKITKSLAVFASVLLIIIIGVASFAYFGTFNVNLNNNVAVNINSSSPGDATFTSKGATLSLQVPAVNMSQTNAGTLASQANATLSVELTGPENLSTTCIYDVVYEYNSGSNVYGTSPTTKNGDKEITLQVQSPNGTNNFNQEKNFDSTSISSYKSGNTYTLVSGATITSTGTKTIQNINIIGRYYNLNASQDNLAGKAFSGKIYAVKKTCETKEIPPAKDTILLNNGGKDAIEAKGTPDFTQLATTNEGMYAAEDDLGMSYYFRGAVDNNWVKFGKDSTNKDMYWRIIRINGDGSIRMIYTGTTAPTESTKVVMTGEDISIGTSAFNSSYNSSEYVGYMYTIGEQHGTSTDSEIKLTLDNWYKTTTLETDENTKKLIADQIYCNDRAITSGSSVSTGDDFDYASYTRIYVNSSNPAPTLKCTNASDRFTVNASKGNGALTYPVGLITADEIMMAGGRNQVNEKYYLYTGQNYWSGSPGYWNGSSATLFYVHDYGFLDNNGADHTGAARGVISLSSESKLLGSGTYNDVYTVN